MIVVAIIAFLATLAVPAGLRARKRSQATSVLNDLRMIDAALELYATENSKMSGAPVAISEWKRYIKMGTPLYETGRDVFGNAFGPQLVGRPPRVPGGTRSVLADTVGDEFWWPYNGDNADESSPSSPASPAQLTVAPAP